MRLSGDNSRRLLPWLGLAVFIFAAWHFGFGYVRHVVAERQLAKNRWPVEFPMRLLGGSYTPAQASEAFQFCEEEIKQQSLKPEELKFLNVKRERTGQTAYRFSGEVEGINQYGVRVRADFAISVTTRRIDPLRGMPAGWVGQGAPREKVRAPFYVMHYSLADSGLSRIWRGNINGVLDPYRQRPGTASPSHMNRSRMPFQNERGGAQQMYGGDR